MSSPTDRRGFLAGLARLPLIGGGVTLIGNPTAAAEPVTEALLDSYDAFLFYERRTLRHQRGLGNKHRPYGVASTLAQQREDWAGIEVVDFIPIDNAGGAYHWRQDRQDATARAAIVLASVGCDWRRP